MVFAASSSIFTTLADEIHQRSTERIRHDAQVLHAVNVRCGSAREESDVGGENRRLFSLRRPPARLLDRLLYVAAGVERLRAPKQCAAARH